MEHQRYFGLYWILRVILLTRVTLQTSLTGAPNPVGQNHLCLLSDSILRAVPLESREEKFGLQSWEFSPVNRWQLQFFLQVLTPLLFLGARGAGPEPRDRQQAAVFRCVPEEGSKMI